MVIENLGLKYAGRKLWSIEVNSCLNVKWWQSIEAQKIAINWENGNDKGDNDKKVNKKNYVFKLISFERQQFVISWWSANDKLSNKSHLVFAGVCQMMITKEWEENMFKKKKTKLSYCKKK